MVQTLLIISGTLEVNPGPDISKRTLSFAVWDLDRIPGRDSLQEFHLLKPYKQRMILTCLEWVILISNENILSNGFSPDSFRSDKSPTIRNGEGYIVAKSHSIAWRPKDFKSSLPHPMVHFLFFGLYKCSFWEISRIFDTKSW